MRVVLVGKGQMLCSLIEGCLACGGVEIVGVLRYDNLISHPVRVWFDKFFKTSYENTLIRKYRLRDLSFNSVNSREFRSFLLTQNVDLMLVGTWREKISEETYNIPKLASVNVHPSLLPKYRGPNPYLQVIKNQEKYSGFSFHLIAQGFDTGAILYQKKVEILPYYTSKELRDRIVFEVKHSIPEFLVALDKGAIIPLEQNEAVATYFSNIDENEKMLDFSCSSADEIIAKVKALHPWLPAYIVVGEDFYIANPYQMSIISGCEDDINLFEKRIIKLCADGRCVVFNGVEKYHSSLKFHPYKG